MKKIFLYIGILIVCSDQLCAQIGGIDFSVLNQYRNWRPPRQNRPYNNNNTVQSASQPEVTQPDPAELQREAEETAKYETGQVKKIQAKWQPLEEQTVISPSRLVTVGSGSNLFGGKPLETQVMIAPLGKMMEGSGVATEDLRRTAAILGAAARGGSDEDDAYLVGQASEAMEGGALSVIVPATGSLQPQQDEALQDLGHQIEILEGADRERKEVIQEFMTLKKPDGTSISLQDCVRNIRETTKTIETAKKQIAADQIIMMPPGK